MDDLLSILKLTNELPISVLMVALFAWFNITNNREWRSYLTDRNGKLEKYFQDATKATKDLNETLARNTKVLMRHMIDNDANQSDINELLD